MQPSKFDELTKALANSTSRRHALKTIVTASVGSLVGFGGIRSLFGGKSRPDPCQSWCNSVFGSGTPAAKQCTSDAAQHRGLCYQCGTTPARSICCVRNKKGFCTSYTGANCCATTQVCRNGVCGPCIPAGNNCSKSSDCCSHNCCHGVCCDSGQTCVNGTCCSSNQVCNCGCCPSGQTCLNGSCCPTANVCGSVCLSAPCDTSQCQHCDPTKGACVGCPSGHTCQGGMCCDDTGTACSANTDCCSNNCCDGVCCDAGQTCLNNTSCCPTAQVCGNSCGCPSGQTCINNSCCPTANVCGSVCLPAPCDPSQCQTCDPSSGTCVGCTSGQTCIAGQCCPTANVCGLVCLVTPCDSSQCQHCDPTSGTCVGCPSGHTCQGGVCCDDTGTTCSANTDCCSSNCCGGTCCDANETCLNNTTCCPTGQACGSVCGCPSGQTCINGSCCPLGNICGLVCLLTPCDASQCQTCDSNSGACIGCSSDQTCINGSCCPTANVCGSVCGCPQGQTCSNGQCVSGGGGCFVAGTPVVMAGGYHQSIDSIQVGDTILAWHEDTRQIFPTTVVDALHHEETMQTLFDIELEDRRKFTVNDNHPMYVAEDEGFIVSRELPGRFGNGKPITFVGNDNQPVKVVSLRTRTERCKVYNLHVKGQGEKGHTYFANGIVVHNKIMAPSGSKPGGR